ncbi:V-type ATP synthase subunit E [Salinivirga cyanobacteriivorans]|uniref:V-type ATP synthase subunit E n=1 Tax=Salinivirga cyanobacteriivorans TaxID=1307839 RepID=A0A0S2I2A7_9BACT|nr:V-type ATP synthase subunit E family protein [Salinivirga cyanobacteriivorans]ALO16404.1 V-type ATP synthase subunit E [Salinivirga cyanobacteriivorans]
MTTKLQDLTNKVYNEGVQKANEEAESILKEAKEKAAAIENKAKEDAEKMKADAQKEAEEIKKHMESEMKMAIDQSVAALKQDVANLVTMQAIQPTTKELFSDKKFLGSLIQKVVEGWVNRGEGDISVILPEADKKEMESYFKNELASQLNEDIKIDFSNDVKAGFKIGPADGSYVISFTEQDFNNFFQTYLRPKTRELLFEE